MNVRALPAVPSPLYSTYGCSFAYFQSCRVTAFRCIGEIPAGAVVDRCVGRAVPLNVEAIRVILVTFVLQFQCFSHARLSDSRIACWSELCASIRNEIRVHPQAVGFEGRWHFVLFLGARQIQFAIYLQHYLRDHFLHFSNCAMGVYTRVLLRAIALPLADILNV